LGGGGAIGVDEGLGADGGVGEELEAAGGIVGVGEGAWEGGLDEE
jgi:hypothetical protein